MSSTTTKAKGLSLDEHLGHLIRRLNQKSVAQFLSLSSDFGITPPQYAVLVALDELGPSSQRRISQHIAMEASNLHGLLKRMEEGSLIAIGTDAGNGRRSKIMLTDSGQRLLAELKPVVEETNWGILEALTPEEQATFVALLKRVVKG